MNEDQTTRVTSVQSVLDGAPTGNECLVVIYGANIGRKYEMFEDVVTIGRDPENTIVLDSDSVSRRHARIEKLMNDRFIIDMDSTNGTYLSDTPVKPRAKLTSGSFIKIGDTIFKYLAGDHIETAYFEEIYRMMVIDGLTQISNKRAMDDFLEKEMARSRRYQRPLSALMMDIDHFKQVNDAHGHLTGDVVLKEMASVVMHRIRREEMFARYGGEEFVIILPETDRVGGIEFAEDVRRMVEDMTVNFEGQSIEITLSIGVAEFDHAQHKTPDDLLKASDKNLYVAKREGRNCVRG